jgi:hypothetical protein
MQRHRSDHEAPPHAPDLTTIKGGIIFPQKRFLLIKTF